MDWSGPNRPQWIEMDRSDLGGPKWTELTIVDSNGPNELAVDQNGLKWPKMVQSGCRIIVLLTLEYNNILNVL